MLSRLGFALRQSTRGQRRLFARRQYASAPTAAAPSQMARMESRLPRFLRHIITPLRTAPVSHITSFLILHELTAIVPLFGFTAAFHYFDWLPPYISEGKWCKEGVEKFGKYLRKKGWIKEETRTDRWFGRSEGGVKIVVEIATAYALVKLLIPVRLLLSVWATPWFARTAVLPLGRRVRNMFRKGTSGKAVASPAAGTNAIAGGVVSRSSSRAS